MSQQSLLKLSLLDPADDCNDDGSMIVSSLIFVVFTISYYILCVYTRFVITKDTLFSILNANLIIHRS